MKISYNDVTQVESEDYDLKGNNKIVFKKKIFKKGLPVKNISEMTLNELREKFFGYSYNELLNLIKARGFVVKVLYARIDQLKKEIAQLKESLRLAQANHGEENITNHKEKSSD